MDIFVTLGIGAVAIVIVIVIAVVRSKAAEDEGVEDYKSCDS
jgi:hypothetical protein